MPPADVSAHLQRLRTTGRDLMSLVSSAEPANLRREPAPDEWSAATVVGHLADAELVYGVRLRLIVAEDRPVLTAFDEEAWADRFAEVDDDPRETLARWRALRDSNLRRLAAWAAGDREPTAVHQQKGTRSGGGGGN